VATSYFPASAANLAADYSAFLAGIPNGVAKAGGKVVGSAAAATIIELRQHDGRHATVTLEPRVLATLAVMVSADNVVFYDLAPRQRSQWAGSDMNRDEQEPDCDPELDVYDHFWSANMVCSYPDRSGDWESVTTLSDFCWSRTCIVRT